MYRGMMRGGWGTRKYKDHNKYAMKLDRSINTKEMTGQRG